MHKKKNSDKKGPDKYIKAIIVALCIALIAVLIGCLVPITEKFYTLADKLVTIMPFAAISISCIYHICMPKPTKIVKYFILILSYVCIFITAFFGTVSIKGTNESTFNQTTEKTTEMTESNKLSYRDFLDGLESNRFCDIEITTSKIYATDAENEELEYEIIRVKDDELVNRLKDAGIDFHQKVSGDTSNIINIITTCIYVAVMLYVLKNVSGKGVFGGSTAKEYESDEMSNIHFSDVAGEDEAKESLMEIVDILHNPDKYTEVGAKLPKGVLLVGPPGTGKTLLAKAVAGEAGVPFFSIAGSEFVEMFVGLGAKRVRNLFREAEKNAPCIIFIDEIDAVARKRGSSTNSNTESEQTLNQLLSEMDGFDSSKGIVIIAATNRPEVLDKALLRPGRFDRQVTVEQPDLEGRIAILNVHAKNLNLDADVDFKELALMTTGASGADLANIMNEGAINTARNNRTVTTQKDLMDAAETILTGKEKKNRILSNEEKKIVAHHEIGHAIVTAFINQKEPVQKITIIPRTNGALGYVLQVPEEDRYLYSKTDLENKIMTLLGGRAAEELFLGDISTGAANDLERATMMVKEYIARYGMSSLGCFGFVKEDSKYLGERSLFCGQEMEAKIDEETVRILNLSYEKVKKILEAHKEKMILLSNYLYEHETITGQKFMELFES